MYELDFWYTNFVCVGGWYGVIVHSSSLSHSGAIITGLRMCTSVIPADRERIKIVTVRILRVATTVALAYHMLANLFPANQDVFWFFFPGIRMVISKTLAIAPSPTEPTVQPISPRLTQLLCLY